MFKSSPSSKPVALGIIIAFLVSGCTGGSAPETTGESVSEQQKAADKASLEWYADFHRLDSPPEVKVVRWVEIEDSQLVYQQCLTDAGFSSEFEDRLLSKEEERLINLAAYTCRAQYPVKVHPKSTEWGEKQIKRQYEWTVVFLIPCLAEQGFTAEDVPSEATFIDTWESDPYYPARYVELPAENMKPSEQNRRMLEIDYTCPQIIPDQVLYDGVSIEAWRSSRKPFHIEE